MARCEHPEAEPRTRRSSARATWWRARLPWTAAVVVTLALGLGTRAFLTGWVAKYLGVALWATLVYFVIAWVAPRITVRRAVSICLAVSCAVEFLQLTPVPTRLHALHPAFALVFGTTFSALDLPAYALGAGLGALVHHLGQHRPS